MRRALPLLVVLVAAGCGSEASPPPVRPHLPRALAEEWRADARAVAAALASGDDCGALSRASALQTSVIDAVNARRVPPRFQEELLAGVNAVAARITCTPPAPVAHPGKGHGKKEHGKKKPKGHEKK